MDVSQVAGPAPAAHTGQPPKAERRPVDSRALSVLLVALLTLAGAVLRVVVAHQSLFADELSTYWIVTSHGLGGVLSTVHSDAEITPPLYFVAAWIAAQISHAPELIRVPSLVAGIATIPLVYLLGLRTIGRAGALIAAALTTVAPFMVYYSAEARGYGVMMAFTVLSTLAMLWAVDSGRTRAWVLYALASVAAAYSHYTCFFVLAVQFLWLLWAHPEARRPALLANVGAAVLYLPWITGLINDFTSPTGKILSALSPFNADAVRVILEHWSVGFPYTAVSGLRGLPGIPALILLLVALLLAVGGISRRVGEARARGRLDRRLGLVALMFMAVLVCEAAVSAVSTHLFAVRNLAPAWPPLALLLGAALAASGARLRYAAAALAIASFAIGAVTMLGSQYQRPQFQKAAALIDRTAGPHDVVIDGTGVLSPGPLTGYDAVSKGTHTVIRSGFPAERDHPFNVFDRVVPVQQGIDRVVAAARGHRIFLVGLFPRKPGQPALQTLQAVSARAGTWPAPYRLRATRIYPGIVNVDVQTYAP